MNKMLNLKDEMGIAGSTDGFFEVNNDISEITKRIDIYGSEITFLSLCLVPEFQVEGKYSFYVLNKSSVTGFIENGKNLPIGTIGADTFPPELYEEMAKTTNLMLIIGSDKYIVSDIVMPTLVQRAGVNGEMTVARQNFVRNLHFADAILSKNEKISFIYREINGIKKIFAAMSGNYNFVPQTILKDIYDRICEDKVLGLPNIIGWEISQTFTKLKVSFPDAAVEVDKKKIIPGLILMTSDTGHCSITARGIYSIDRNGYIISEDVTVKHIGDIDIPALIAEIDEKLFSKIRAFPEQLVELMGISLLDYSKLDLTKESDAAKNMERCSVFINKVISALFKGVLPKKHQISIRECLNDEINSSIPYTALDICMSLLGIPERLAGSGVNSVIVTNVRKALIDCPKKCLELGNKDTAKEADEIYLSL